MFSIRKNHIQSTLLSSPLLKNATKMVSSNILLYLLPFIATPILSRIYDPSFFGEWGVFSSSFQIINVILFLCYDQSIIKVNDQECPTALVLSFLISIGTIFIVLLFFWGGYLFDMPFFVEFPCKFNLLLLLIFSSISVILQKKANRDQSYWILSFSSVILGVTQVIFRILLGFFIIFPNGLIAGTTIAQFICMCFLICFVGKEFSQSYFHEVSIGALKHTAIKYKKFPLYEAPATLLTFATFNLSLIILSLYYTKAEIGCMSVIHQLLLLPISLVGGALASVYYQQVSSIQNGKQNIVNPSRQMLKIVILLAVLPTLFLSLGGDYLINIFLGKKWENSGIIAICMTVWSISNILTQPLLPIFRIKDKQNYLLYFNILNFVLAVGSLLICCQFHVQIHVALLLYSWLSAIANFLMFLKITKLAEINVRSVITIPLIILYVITFTSLIIRYFHLF